MLTGKGRDGEMIFFKWRDLDNVEPKGNSVRNCV